MSKVLSSSNQPFLASPSIQLSRSNQTSFLHLYNNISTDIYKPKPFRNHPALASSSHYTRTHYTRIILTTLGTTYYRSLRSHNNRLHSHSATVTLQPLLNSNHYARGTYITVHYTHDSLHSYRPHYSSRNLYYRSLHSPGTGSRDRWCKSPYFSSSPALVQAAAEQEQWGVPLGRERSTSGSSSST